MMMAKLLKLGLKHEYHQDNTYYLRRRIPTDLLEWYRTQGVASGYIQRTTGTSDPKVAKANWPRIQAELEAEWARIRDHLRTANTPQTLDQIDETTAKTLIWKCWVAWRALGFESTKAIDDFGGWALRVLEKLPTGVDYLTPRAVKDWHDTIDQRPQVRMLSPFAQNAVAREVPNMIPALKGMQVLDLAKNPVYALPTRKAKMLGEVMDAWYASHRRKNLKVNYDKDGNPVKVADKNYDVPFKVARDVLGENTVVSHITRDDVLELVDVICNLPKGAHDVHDRDGTPFRVLAMRAKEALEQGDEVEFNADSSLNKYLGGITTLFTFAVNNTWLTQNPANDIKILGGNGSKRRALSADELAALFHSGYQPVVNSWVPLLLVYHGCRTNEIAQLDVADIVQRPGGLWCLNLTEEVLEQVEDTEGTGRTGGKSLKTVASRRLIPVHHSVLDRGFIDFVAARRRDGHRKLFNVAGTSAWDSIRQDIYAMFAAAGVYKKGEVVPYSFRHTWTAMMTEAKVTAEVQEAIGGWSLSGGARKNYGRKRGTQVVRYEPEALVDDLNKLQIQGLFMHPPPDGWRMATFEKEPRAIKTAT